MKECLSLLKQRVLGWKRCKHLNPERNVSENRDRIKMKTKFLMEQTTKRRQIGSEIRNNVVILFPNG